MYQITAVHDAIPGSVSQAPPDTDMMLVAVREHLARTGRTVTHWTQADADNVRARELRHWSELDAAHASRP